MKEFEINLILDNIKNDLNKLNKQIKDIYEFIKNLQNEFLNYKDYKIDDENDENDNIFHRNCPKCKSWNIDGGRLDGIYNHCWWFDCLNCGYEWDDEEPFQR